MKTQEELNALKEEIEAMNKKLAELNEEELEQVFGGAPPFNPLPLPEPRKKHNEPEFAMDSCYYYCKICENYKYFFKDSQSAYAHANSCHGGDSSVIGNILI